MLNKAVIVGALGVIGRYIVEKFIEEPDWTVVGLSRRKATNSQRYRHIAVDLLDPEDTKRKLAELTDVTHVFYAAFQAAPGSAANLVATLPFTRLRRQHDFRFPLAAFRNWPTARISKGARYQDLRWFPESLLSLADCQS